tara:strand:+ start:239 stop:394 length:156 start_codon:yes stop_codon:yes gene_type:complete
VSGEFVEQAPKAKASVEKAKVKCFMENPCCKNALPNAGWGIRQRTITFSGD